MGIVNILEEGIKLVTGSAGLQVKELSSTEEDQFEKNIVWLFGHRRSGTTWLGKQLLSFNTAFVFEPDITFHLEQPVGVRDHKLMRTIEVRKHMDDYFFSDKYKPVWNYFLRKMILNRFYGQIQNLSLPVIVKEPSSRLGASDILSECLPNSKLIVLIRDGRDIIDSLVDSRSKVGWQNIRPNSVITEKNRVRVVEDLAKNWVQQMENLMRSFENHEESQKMLVRYEDLIEKPSVILKKIYDFLKIEISLGRVDDLIQKYNFDKIPENKKGPGKFFRSATPGKWKENFNDEEKKIMEEIMGKSLKKLEYS